MQQPPEQEKKERGEGGPEGETEGRFFQVFIPCLPFAYTVSLCLQVPTQNYLSDPQVGGREGVGEQTDGQTEKSIIEACNDHFSIEHDLAEELLL